MPSASSSVFEKTVTRAFCWRGSRTIVLPVISATWLTNSRMGMSAPLTTHVDWATAVPASRIAAISTDETA